MAVEVLGILTSVLANRLTEMVAADQDNLLWESSAIDGMVIKLRHLNDLIVEADRRIITHQSAQEWVRDLMHASFDADDILDLCQLKTYNTGCFIFLLPGMQNLRLIIDIGFRIKILNKRIDGLMDRSSSFNFTNLGNFEDRGRNMVLSDSRTRRETSGALESGLVGGIIEEDTRNLVQVLTNNDQSHKDDKSILVFAIVGAGGIHYYKNNL